MLLCGHSEIVRHHLDQVRSFKNYDLANFVAPYRSDLESVDFFVMDSPKLVQGIAKASELRPNRRLTEPDIRGLIAFLQDETALSYAKIGFGIDSRLPVSWGG